MAIEQVRCARQKVCGFRHGRVKDQRVNAAMVRDDIGDGALDVGRVTGVGDDAPDVVLDPRRCAIDFSLATTGQEHRRALGRQALHDRLADTARTPNHQGYLVRHASHRILL